MSAEILEMLEFLHKSRRIKDTVRYSNNDMVEVKDTVTSHSWRATEIGVLLSPYLEAKDVNSAEVVKMLDLHDLLEIESSEVEALGHRDRVAKQQHELEVAKRLFLNKDGKPYQGKWKEEAEALLKEFLEQNTLEAKIAKAIENYESNMHVIEEVRPVEDPTHRKLTIDYIERRRGLVDVLDELITAQIDEINAIPEKS